MKKLLSIVASALALGAFADAGRAPITFANLDIAENDAVSFVCEGKTIHTITVDASMAKFRSITISTDGLDAGSYALMKGDATTEPLEVATTASAPQFSVSGFISSEARRLHWVKTDADNNEWSASTTALVEGTESAASITKADTLIVDADFDKALYLNDCPARNYEIAGGEIHVSHAGSDGQNFPSGSSVTIADKATLVLRRWNKNEKASGGGTYKVNIDGVTFLGDGIVKVVEHAAEVNGKISGNATVDVSSVALSAIKDKLTFADSWVGTIKLPVIETIAGDNANHELNFYGNANSKIAISGIGGGWLKRGITVPSTLVLEGDMKISDWSQDTYTFASIEGSGNFTVVKEGSYAPNGVVIKKLDASKYTGSINAGVNLTISALETAFENVPTTKTRVVALAKGTDISKISVTAKLADGTAIDAANVFVEEDGIYVGPVAPAYPEFVPETDEGRAAYDTWATEHAEAIATATAADIKAGFILGCAPTASALQTVANDLISADIVAALANGNDAGLESLLNAIEAAYGDKVTIEMTPATDIEGVDTTTTHLFKLKITIK